VVLGPADLVTLARLSLACALAALVVESLAGAVAPRSAVVTISAVALLLDAVDGQVARRTRSASEFGARFDGEADAFLLLVLSGYVALELTPWAILIGAARYLFAAAGLPWPWLRARLPRRDWRKVVTATQGIVLLVAASGLLPDRPLQVALVVALVLLAESFGRDVWWLWRRRPTATAGAVGMTTVRRVRP
jgi:phosphatidylglycerophosphate synthase